MNGKEKCKLLKKIREMIAKKNGIPYQTEECTAKGDCKGYCPKCDEELRDLNKAIAEKEVKDEKKEIPNTFADELMARILKEQAEFNAMSDEVREKIREEQKRERELDWEIMQTKGRLKEVLVMIDVLQELPQNDQDRKDMLASLQSERLELNVKYEIVTSSYEGVISRIRRLRSEARGDYETLGMLAMPEVTSVEEKWAEEGWRTNLKPLTWEEITNYRKSATFGFSGDKEKTNELPPANVNPATTVIREEIKSEIKKLVQMKKEYEDLNDRLLDAYEDMRFLQREGDSEEEQEYKKAFEQVKFYQTKRAELSEKMEKQKEYILLLEEKKRNIETEE